MTTPGTANKAELPPAVEEKEARETIEQGAHAPELDTREGHDAPTHVALRYASQEPIEHGTYAPELDTRDRSALDSQAPERVPLKHAFEMGEHEAVGHEDANTAGNGRKRTCFGFRRRTVLIAVAVMMLVIVGAIVGGVVGTQSRASSGGAATSPLITSSSTPTSASSTPSPTPTALSIIEARFGTADVTKKVRETTLNGTHFNVDMNIFWADTDPLFGLTKCLAILHSFGADIRTFAACESTNPEVFSSKVEDVGKNTQAIARRKSPFDNFDIVSLVWGEEIIVTQRAYDSLYNFWNNGSELTFNNELFLFDNLKGVGKSGVIWYTIDNYKSFKSLNGFEGTKAKFSRT